MTREEIENIPKIVDCLLSESVMSESRENLHKRLDEICNLAIKALEQESKAGWIPVGERLPVTEGYYLTTTIYHEVFCDYWNGERFERTETVIAWMELPEAYKEG